MNTNRDTLEKFIAHIGSHFVYDSTMKDVAGLATIPYWNTTALTLTYLLNGNAYILGEPGRAKTMAARILGATLGDLPIDLFDQAMIKGHPNQNMETMVGRLDFGAMNQGEEVVIFQAGISLPVMIIDELPRLPPGSQTMILNAFCTGNFDYLNDCACTGKKPFLTTANHPDDGNHKLIPPILDRLDFSLEMGYGGPTAREKIRTARQNIAQLSDVELSQKVLETLRRHNGNSKTLQPELEQYQHQYRQILNDRKLQIPQINAEMRSQIVRDINAVKLVGVDDIGQDNEAAWLLKAIEAECNMTYDHGLKRSADPPSENEHDKAYANSKIKNALSDRAIDALELYAKAVAYMRGDSQVRKADVIAVAPQVIGHRLSFIEDNKSDYQQANRTAVFGERGAPMEMFLAHQLVNMIDQNFTREVKQTITAVIQYCNPHLTHLLTGDGRKLAEETMTSELRADHPLLRGIVDDYRCDQQRKQRIRQAEKS